ncbi:fimbrial protein [Citrobacter sedlakii]|nr:fimbrial protein [Citrobacter sedlakii]MCK8144416.1 fimbrial protein [Citrobacter sedlakii]
MLSGALALFVYAGVQHCALATGDPVTLNITGTVVATPCEVGEDSVPTTISLNGSENTPLQTADLNAAGSASDWIPFTVTLKNCPAGTSSVTATFVGASDADDPETLYKNGGDALNVAVQLEGKAGEPYGNGKTSTLQIASNMAVWELQTRAFTKNGGVTPGEISAVITMNFEYK